MAGRRRTPLLGRTGLGSLAQCDGNPVSLRRLGISLDAGQPCLKSPGLNPRALTAASGSRPHASTFSFGAIIAPIIALAFSGSCSATKRTERTVEPPPNDPLATR